MEQENNVVQTAFDFDNNEIVKKFNLSITTTDEIRTAIWAPLTKVTHSSNIYKNFIANKRTREISSNFGDIKKVIVSGNILDQSHKGMLDTIMSVGSEIKQNNDGLFYITFSRYKVLTELGAGTGNYKTIDNKLREIKNASIELIINEGETDDRKVSLGIINSIYQDGEGNFGVIFTREYINHFATSLTMDYSQYLSKINNISGVGAGLMQAAVRFFLTQDVRSKPYVIRLENLLDKLGHESTPRSIRKFCFVSGLY